jgi:hypothetical protein
MPALNFAHNLVDGLFLVTEFAKDGTPLRNTHVSNANVNAELALLVFEQLGASCFEKPSQIAEWVKSQKAPASK